MFNFFRNFTKKEKIVTLIALAIFMFSSYQVGEAFYLAKTESIPADGGMITFGAVGEARLFFPLRVDLTEPEREINSLIFSGLLRFDSLTGEMISDLAEMDISSDRKVYTLKLKENIFWHDGEKLTAEDVVFTFHDIIQNPDFPNPILRTNFTDINISNLDARTVIFKLPRPYAFFPQNLNIPILPKHILKNINPTELASSPINISPIGSGPYKLKSFVSEGNSQQITLQAFGAYYGSRPRIPSLVFRTFSSESELATNLNSLNVAHQLNYQNLIALKNNFRFKIFDFYLPRYIALFLNLEKPVFNDRKTRQALATIVNKEILAQDFPQARIFIDTPYLNQIKDYKFDAELAKKAFDNTIWKIRNTNEIKKKEKEKEINLINEPNAGHDFATAKNSFFIQGQAPVGTKKIIINDYVLKKFDSQKNIWTYLASVEIGTLKKGLNRYEVFAEDVGGKKAKIGALQIFFDIDEQKRKEWEEKQIKNEIVVENINIDSGAQLAQNIVNTGTQPRILTNEVGEQLTLNLLTSKNPPQYEAIANKLKKMLVDYGIKLKVVIADEEEFQNLIKKHDYDILLYGQSLDYNQDPYAFWHSTQNVNGLNFSQYNSFPANALLIEMRESFAKARLREKLSAFSQILKNDVPAIFLFTPASHLVFDQKIKNIEIKHVGANHDFLLSINKWYILEKRKWLKIPSISEFWQWLENELKAKSEKRKVVN